MARVKVKEHTRKKARLPARNQKGQFRKKKDRPVGGGQLSLPGM